jgi:hypothetical protein
LSEYDPRQVRNVLRELNCTEIITADETIRYFQNSKGLTQLRMHEMVDDDQLDIMAENIGHDPDDFRDRVKKDRKHKK